MGQGRAKTRRPSIWMVTKAEKDAEPTEPKLV
jgi:hypothetical protein